MQLGLNESRLRESHLEHELYCYLRDKCENAAGDVPKGLCKQNGVPTFGLSPKAWIGSPGLQTLRDKKMANGALAGVYILKGTLTLQQGTDTVTTEVYYLLDRLDPNTGEDAVKIYK